MIDNIIGSCLGVLGLFFVVLCFKVGVPTPLILAIPLFAASCFFFMKKPFSTPNPRNDGFDDFEHQVLAYSSGNSQVNDEPQPTQTHFNAPNPTDSAVEPEHEPEQFGGLIKCPYCMEDIQKGAIKCKHCMSNLKTNPQQLSSPNLNNMHFDGISDCIEAVKSPNTPCLWVSLDYWNLYLLEDRVMAVRCYRGKWGAIGFIIGLFFAVVGFLIVGALGLFWDKSSGEAKCKSFAGRVNEILKYKQHYKIIEAPWSSVSSTVDASDLCLGNLWLKYRVYVGGKKFYFEGNRYEQIMNAITKHHR